VKLILALSCKLFRFSAVSWDMDDTISIGLQAIASGFDKLTRDSIRAVQASNPNSSEDIVPAITGLAKDALEIGAGNAIIRTGAELYRYTIDIMA
jgi:hypothetical protein